MPELRKRAADFHVDLNEMAQRSATKEDVILRIEEGRRLKALQEAADRRRRRLHVVVAGFIMLILIVAGGVSVYKLSFQQPTGTVPVPSSPSIGITVVDKTTEASDYYVLTKAVVKSQHGDIGLYTYDFYSNRFLKNQDVLTDPDLMRDIFRRFRTNNELQKRIQNSWVLIFAGASSEGTQSHNLELTCERVRAIAKMMSMEVGLSSQGYWAIRAGEFKGTGPNDMSLSDEEQERVLSKMTPQERENRLGPQRRLLVAIVTPQYSVSKADEDQTMTSLSNEFYKNNLLPDGYQYSLQQSRTKPMPIDLNELSRPSSSCSPKPKNRLNP